MIYIRALKFHEKFGVRLHVLGLQRTLGPIQFSQLFLLLKQQLSDYMS